MSGLSEGNIGVCGIGQFFLRYFGNFNLKCGIVRTCRMRFLHILDGIRNYPISSPTFPRVSQFPIGHSQRNLAVVGMENLNFLLQTEN